MHYTASAAKAYITAGSDASMNEKGKSAGIAFQVEMTIERNATMLTEVIAEDSFHVQVENIDDAEGIGVLVAMDWIRSNMVEILQKNRQCTRCPTASYRLAFRSLLLGRDTPPMRGV